MKIHLYQDQQFNIFSCCSRILRQLNFSIQIADEERGLLRGSKESEPGLFCSLLDLQVSKHSAGYSVTIISNCFMGSSGTFYHDRLHENEFAERFIEEVKPERFENAFRLRESDKVMTVIHK